MDATRNPPSAGPLAGIRVLDLTRVLAGPYAAMLLADMGADVIKVEGPEGDPTRTQGPFLEGDEQPAFGGYFQSVNRNKRSIVLDLKSPSARLVLRRLVAGSDALIENFRVGVMERLGCAYETLREENPALVYTAVRGFGDPRTGATPYTDWPALDVVAQAMGGLMSITGPGPGQPMKVGPGIGDIFPGALAALATVSAIVHAQRTGEGQFVDVAMYDSIVSLCERLVYQHSYTGEVPGPEGNEHPLMSPFSVYPANDGSITIAAPLDHQWHRLCELLGAADVGREPRFATRAGRSANRDEIRAMITDWTSVRSTKEVLAVLGGEVPVGPIQDAAAICADEHTARREMVVPLEQPGTGRTAAVAGTPMKFAGTRPRPLRRGPLLGEDTDAILEHLDFSAAEIDELRRDGAFGAGVG